METNCKDDSGPPTSKKVKTDDDDSVEFGFNIANNNTVNILEIWNGDKTEDAATSVLSEVVSVSTYPFQHVQIQGFLKKNSFLEALSESVESKVKFEPKSKDLYQFRSSCDIIGISIPAIQSLKHFFETEVYQFLKSVTGINLNGKVDMFVSEYCQTDFLLCHDDELESRRIAFIYYLSKDWQAEFGGTLDFYSSSEGILPLEIVKSLVPLYNSFVFFNVTSASFHQVSEVLVPDKSRYAISGWFYGDPLPRPKLTFVCSKPYTPKLNTDIQISKFFNAEYCDGDNYRKINGSLEETSIAKLKGFLKTKVANNLVKTLKDIQWKSDGVPIIASYFSPLFEISTENLDSIPNAPKCVQDLVSLFHSKEFIEFLEKITEFNNLQNAQFANPKLRKFGHKNYGIVGHRSFISLKAEPKSENGEDENEVGCEFFEEEEGSSEECENDKNEVENGHEDLEAGISPNNNENKMTKDDQHQCSSSNSQEQNHNFAPNEDESEEDSDSDIYEAEAEETESENSEEDEVEMRIDVLYFIGDFEWKDEYGGINIYLDEDGKELLRVGPESNTMCVVVREKTVVPYVSYINCLCKNQSYTIFSFTLRGFES